MLPRAVNARDVVSLVSEQYTDLLAEALDGEAFLADGLSWRVSLEYHGWVLVWSEGGPESYHATPGWEGETLPIQVEDPLSGGDFHFPEALVEQWTGNTSADVAIFKAALALAITRHRWGVLWPAAFATWSYA